MDRKGDRKRNWIITKERRRKTKKQSREKTNKIDKHR